MLLIMQPSKVLYLIHFSQKVFHFKTTKVRDKKGGKAMFHQVCVCVCGGGSGLPVSFFLTKNKCFGPKHSFKPFLFCFWNVNKGAKKSQSDPQF